MEQIKLKEAPTDWLVLDHHVQSGNVELISKEIKYVKKPCGKLHCWHCGYNKDSQWYQEKATCIHTYTIPEEVFGTKHIQLVAANPHLHVEEYEQDWYGYGHFEGTYGKETVRDFEVWSEIEHMEEQGKDYFIYKVSEEK